MKTLDVITIGRSSVDLYGTQIGGRLEDMGSFQKYVGGSPTNMATGTAPQTLILMPTTRHAQLGQTVICECNMSESNCVCCRTVFVQPMATSHKYLSLDDIVHAERHTHATRFSICTTQCRINVVGSHGSFAVLLMPAHHETITACGGIHCPNVK